MLTLEARPIRIIPFPPLNSLTKNHNAYSILDVNSDMIRGKCAIKVQNTLTTELSSSGQMPPPAS